MTKQALICMNTFACYGLQAAATHSLEHNKEYSHLALHTFVFRPEYITDHCLQQTMTTAIHVCEVWVSYKYKS